MRSWEPYLDKKYAGLVVTKDGGGGDSFASTFRRIIGMWFGYLDQPRGSDWHKLVNTYKRVKLVLQVYGTRHTKGKFVRHPDAQGIPPINDPHDFSRDQYQNWIICAGFFRDIDELHDRFNLLVTDFHYPNGDMITPTCWAMWARAMRCKNLIPIIWLLDSFLVLAVLIRRLAWLIPEPKHLHDNKTLRSKFKFHRGEVSDDINTALQVIQAQMIYPTPLGKLAKWIYGNPQWAWDVYYTAWNNHSAPLNELFKPVFQRIWK